MSKAHAPGKRTYVLDTNVLLYDPGALFVFQEHDLVLPIICVEEIDKFKREMTDRGRAARTWSWGWSFHRALISGKGMHRGIFDSRASPGRHNSAVM